MTAEGTFRNRAENDSIPKKKGVASASLRERTCARVAAREGCREFRHSHGKQEQEQDFDEHVIA